MPLVDRSALADLQRRIAVTRNRGDRRWRQRVEAAVRRWVTLNMPMLRRPTVHVRMLQVASGDGCGRWYARVTISLRPQFMDVLISEDTGT